MALSAGFDVFRLFNHQVHGYSGDRSRVRFFLRADDVPLVSLGGRACPAIRRKVTAGEGPRARERGLSSVPAARRGVEVLDELFHGGCGDDLGMAASVAPLTTTVRAR